MKKADYLARTLPRLEEWAKLYTELNRQVEALRAVVGGVEAPLPDAIWHMWEAYTSSVSEIVGDGYEWLAWYCYDCQMGREPKEVSTRWGTGKMKVKTIKQLAALLWEVRDVPT